MKRRLLGLLFCKIDMADVLRASSILAIILMVITFFAACETAKNDRTTDSSSVIREPESGHEVHGEVGAMYGHSF